MLPIAFSFSLELLRNKHLDPRLSSLSTTLKHDLMPLFLFCLKAACPPTPLPRKVRGFSKRTMLWKEYDYFFFSY